ncbi:ester cyclase [Nocardia sp. NPDC051463]|uniref:ester cyclase n=1 Tax=Nocardia sp. NPDC051463 TaxID=3154845 RepID=UPI003414984A
MTTPTNPGAVARRYIEAIAAQDWETVAACWQPGAIDDFVGIARLRAPEDVVDYFRAIHRAVPDFRAEIISVTEQDDRAAVHWRMWGTFDGTEPLIGVAPNGCALNILGTDVFVVHDGAIAANTAIANGLEIARQLAIMPAQGSRAERLMFMLVNSVAPVTKALRARRRRSPVT